MLLPKGLAAFSEKGVKAKRGPGGAPGTRDLLYWLLMMEVVVWCGEDMGEHTYCEWKEGGLWG